MFSLNRTFAGMNRETASYIAEHAEDDVHQLALKSVPEGVDLTFALEQISGRQMALRKLPTWAATESIIYPPHLNMEQCSSEHTAQYKAQLCRKLNNRQTMVDLTGGYGVDFSFMAREYEHAVYVEQQPLLCELATHNMPILGIDNIDIKNADSIDYINSIEHVSLLFLDPARRDLNGRRTYALEDCSPDVVSLHRHLLTKCDYLLLKLSPMFDWREATKQLEHVCEVHIVSTKNECKELLVLLSRQDARRLRVICANDDDVFEFFPETKPAERTFSEPACGQFIYEPNSSVMKAGCFDEVAHRWGVAAIAPHSHLFVSEKNIPSFPGRKFQISAISSMNKQSLKTLFTEIRQAHVSVRNFPMSAHELKQKLHLKDGGDIYVFGTTTNKRQHILLVCRKNEE